MCGSQEGAEGQVVLPGLQGSPGAEEEQEEREGQGEVGLFLVPTREPDHEELRRLNPLAVLSHHLYLHIRYYVLSVVHPVCLTFEVYIWEKGVVGT